MEYIAGPGPYQQFNWQSES